MKILSLQYNLTSAPPKDHFLQTIELLVIQMNLKIHAFTDRATKV